MQTSSITDALSYNDLKPNVSVLLETENTKEIRILMKAGQLMKEHQTPFPIVVEIFEGSIEFGVNGKVLALTRGDLLSLEGGVPHNVQCISDSIIRLSLSKKDQVERVRKVID